MRYLNNDLMGTDKTIDSLFLAITDNRKQIRITFCNFVRYL